MSPPHARGMTPKKSSSRSKGPGVVMTRQRWAAVSAFDWAETAGEIWDDMTEGERRAVVASDIEP